MTSTYKGRIGITGNKYLETYMGLLFWLCNMVFQLQKLFIGSLTKSMIMKPEDTLRRLTTPFRSLRS
jgi:hypothetical protein